jgi:hypothetical protein
MLASVVRIAGALLFIACINASPVPIPWLIAVAVAILMIGYHGKAGQSDAAPRRSVPCFFFFCKAPPPGCFF